MIPGGVVSGGVVSGGVVSGGVVSGGVVPGDFESLSDESVAQTLEISRGAGPGSGWACLNGRMRSRHRIVELGPVSDHPEACRGLAGHEFSGRGETPLMNRTPFIDETPLMNRTVFIDETPAPEAARARWLTPVDSGGTTGVNNSGYGVRSATIRPGPMVGNGSRRWPGHNSRLVRLFACDPEAFLHGVVGHRRDGLRLGDEVRVVDEGHRFVGDWPRGVMGELRMPYAAPPLVVELVCQPFNDRYARVDLVLRSRYRRPRRYFAVAFRCLSGMRWLENTAR